MAEDMTPAPGTAQPVADMTRDQAVDLLLALSTEGKAHSAKALDAITRARATEEILTLQLQDVTIHKIESDKALKAIDQVLRQLLHPKPDDSSKHAGGGSGRLATTILLVGVVGLAFGASPVCSAPIRSEVSPVSQATLDHAAAAMTAGKYASAKSLFLSFRKDTRIDPEVSLGRAAECAYYLHEDQQSLELCDELAAVSPSSYTAPYLRGKVLIRQGKPALAQKQFELATFYGHPRAALIAHELAAGVR